MNGLDEWTNITAATAPGSLGISLPLSFLKYISQFTYCLDAVGESAGVFATWHSGTHHSVGGTGDARFDRHTQAMNNTQGDLFDPDTSPQGQFFTPFHAALDMFIREWASRNNEYAPVTWGLPYRNPFNLFFLDDETYPGINGNDTMASAWPIYWQDVGWAETGTPQAMYEVTHAQAHCFLAKENAVYVYVRYSGAPDGAPGEVFDDDDGDDSSSGAVSSHTATMVLSVAAGIASFFLM
jgi:hypothetical protein